jgi:hypothetical protein
VAEALREVSPVPAAVGELVAVIAPDEATGAAAGATGAAGTTGIGGGGGAISCTTGAFARAPARALTTEALGKDWFAPA